MHVCVQCSAGLFLTKGFLFLLQVWDFKGREQKFRLEIGCSLVKIVYHRVNGIIFWFPSGHLHLSLMYQTKDLYRIV